MMQSNPELQLAIHPDDARTLLTLAELGEVQGVIDPCKFARFRQVVVLAEATAR